MKILVSAVLDVPDMIAAETTSDRLEAPFRRRLSWDGAAIEALTVTAYDPAPRPDFAATDVGLPGRPDHAATCPHETGPSQ